MWTLFQLLKCQASRMVAFPVLPEESREALVAVGYQQRHPHSYLSHTHKTHMYGAALLLPPPLGLSKVQQLRLAGLMGWRGCWFYRDVTKRVEQRAEDWLLIDSGVGGMSQGVEGCLVITGPCCSFSAFFIPLPSHILLFLYFASSYLLCDHCSPVSPFHWLTYSSCYWRIAALRVSIKLSPSVCTSSALKNLCVHHEFFLHSSFSKQ